MHDHPHPHQELAEGKAQHVEGHPHGAWKEKAFRLAVARRWAYLGEDTAQIAKALNVDESAVYNILDSVRRNTSA